MGLALLDLDGTIFRHGTNELLDGAQALLNLLIRTGHQIAFTTRRGDREFEGHKVYSKAAAQKAIDGLGIPYIGIIFDAPSPRIVVNDDGAACHNHATNAAWPDGEIFDVAAFAISRKAG